MRIPLNPSKWYQSAYAAMAYFTRLPLWHWYKPHESAYKAMMEYWPLTGWVTGALTGCVLFFGAMVLPWPLVVVAAMVVRLLVTGAIQERGLARFFDRLCGGGDDHRLGPFGVIALVVYEIAFCLCLLWLDSTTATLCLLAADPFSKMLAGEMVLMMPQASSDSCGIAFRKMSIKSTIVLAFQGLLLLLPLFIFCPALRTNWQWLIFAPCLVMYFIYLLIWNRQRGYTLDSCMAMAVMVELTMLIVTNLTLYAQT